MLSTIFRPIRDAIETLADRHESRVLSKATVPEAMYVDPARNLSGVTVTTESAQGLSVVYACIRIISESTAQLPARVLENQADGSKEELRDHPAWWLLNHDANAVMGAFTVRDQLLGWALATGNGYAEIERNGRGEPIGLWPVSSHEIQVRVVTGTRIEYVHTPTDTRIPMEDMLHVLGPGRNGLVGVSPIQLHAETIGVGLATRQHAAGTLGSGAIPRGVLAVPWKTKREERQNIREGWNRGHQGSSRGGRTALLEQGIEWKPLSLSPVDLQLIDQQKWSVEEIAGRVYRVPLFMVGALDRSTFNNQEEQAKAFAELTIGPWLKRAESAYERRLLTEAERRDGVQIRHNLAALLRASLEARQGFYVAGRQWGWFSADDIRRLEDLAPLPDDRGKLYLQPLNMVPAPTPAEVEAEREAASSMPPALEEPSPAEPEGPSARALEPPAGLERRNVEPRQRSRVRFERLFADATRRIVGREATQAARAARRFDTPGEFSSWVDQWYVETRAWIGEQLAAPVAVMGSQTFEAARSAVGPPVGESSQDAFLAAYAEGLADRYVRSSVSQLTAVAAAAGAAGLVEAVDQRLAEWRERRPDKVSRETVRLDNAASREAWREAGVRQMQWVAVGDNCPMCDDLDGRIVGIEAPFGVRGDTFGTDPTTGQAALTLSGTMTHPPLHDGCDCIIVPV